MKKLFILLISIYQGFFSPFIKSILGVNGMCKFSPTCSEYIKRMVKQHGVLGILLGIKRIGACR
ncbi:MAG: membrane protein insertion efficiency factor YidD [Candidatus Levybacteria bacterium]|nr:membrane protein insertion efficiency factor YidD [Candidatus Levybacteria bacterium]